MFKIEVFKDKVIMTMPTFVSVASKGTYLQAFEQQEPRHYLETGHYLARMRFITTVREITTPTGRLIFFFFSNETPLENRMFSRTMMFKQGRLQQ